MEKRALKGHGLGRCHCSCSIQSLVLLVIGVEVSLSIQSGFLLQLTAFTSKSDLFNLPLAILWTAVLGEWDREVEENTELRVPIEKVFVHERFHNFQHDIALMKLSETSRPIDDKLQTICLPERAAILSSSSSSCIATGWGHASRTGSLTPRLLETKIPLHDNSACRSKYGNSVPIRAGHLCAGHLDGSTGTCVGDSGGPLQCSMMDGRWYLAGITSFGSGCAKPGYPDVYTRLSFYLPWIRKKLKQQ